MGINELAAYPNRLFSQSLPRVPNINFTYTVLYSCYLINLTFSVKQHSLKTKFNALWCVLTWRRASEFIDSKLLYKSAKKIFLNKFLGEYS